MTPSTNIATRYRSGAASTRRDGLGGYVVGWTTPFGNKGPALFRAAVKAQCHDANGQAGLLIGKQNLVRIDPAEGDSPIVLDDVDRALGELPNAARSLAESSGHHVNRIFFGDVADPYIKCQVQ